MPGSRIEPRLQMVLKKVLGKNSDCNAQGDLSVTYRSSTRNNRLAAVAIVAAFAIGFSACTRGGPVNVVKAKADGLKAANQWIKLVDAGDYAKAWAATASGFQKEMSEKEWIHGLEGYRKPMGKVLQRTVAEEQYANKLSDSPANSFGNYVVVRYRSRFEHKDSANETVLTMLQDGRWVVAGYFIN